MRIWQKLGILWKVVVAIQERYAEYLAFLCCICLWWAVVLLFHSTHSCWCNMWLLPVFISGASELWTLLEPWKWIFSACPLAVRKQGNNWKWFWTLRKGRTFLVSWVLLPSGGFLCVFQKEPLRIDHVLCAGTRIVLKRNH